MAVAGSAEQALAMHRVETRVIHEACKAVAVACGQVWGCPIED